MEYDVLIRAKFLKIFKQNIYIYQNTLNWVVPTSNSLILFCWRHNCLRKLNLNPHQLSASTPALLLSLEYIMPLRNGRGWSIPKHHNISQWCLPLPLPLPPDVGRPLHRNVAHFQNRILLCHSELIQVILLQKKICIRTNNPHTGVFEPLIWIDSLHFALSCYVLQRWTVN